MLQPPQLAALEVVSTQTLVVAPAAMHSVSLLPQTQALLMQLDPVAHTWPHPPQLPLSLLVSTHMALLPVPHTVPVQVVAQALATQLVVPQLLPHAPQFCASVVRSTQPAVAPQSVRPVPLHLHWPPAQPALGWHLLPQVPQSVAAVWVSTQVPAHWVSVPVQPAPPLPPVGVVVVVAAPEPPMVKAVPPQLTAGTGRPARRARQRIPKRRFIVASPLSPPLGGEAETLTSSLHGRRRRGWKLSARRRGPLLFSMKAFMPACWSSVAKRAAKAWASSSQATGRSSASPSRMTRLAARTASGPREAISRAVSRARSRSSGPGKTALTRPNARACSAVIRPPEAQPSRGRAGRATTRRRSRCVPPKPGMTPSPTSGWPSLAPSAA